jgi:adenylate kinase family enzyme
VIGNGGAGKTTLSQRIASDLNLPLHHTDRIIWQPNWGRTPDDEVRAELTRILAEPKWLIDGLGPLWSIEMRLPAAEHVVFLDYPLDLCKAWAMQRVEEFRDKERPDAPQGCSFNGLEQTLIDLLDRVDREFLPVIRGWLVAPEIALKTSWLRSPDELEALYTHLRDAAAHPGPKQADSEASVRKSRRG